MAVLANLARMVVSAGGTGTLTLSDAVPGFLTFDQAGVANGATVSYAIASGINAEVGRGVYNTANKTLTRGPLRSTNGNAAVDVAVNAQVFITILAEDYNEKANLASPPLTGNPTAPTQAKGNRSTRLASTAFVGNELADFYSRTETDALTWNLSSLQQSTGPNVLGRASGLGAPQFLTPANLRSVANTDRPAFSVVKSSDQSVANGATKITFGSASINVGSVWNFTNHRFTAPVDGTYFLSASIQYALGNDNTGVWGAQIRINNNISRALFISKNYFWQHASLSLLLQLAAGQYVELFATLENMGGAPVIQGQTMFSGFQL